MNRKISAILALLTVSSLMLTACGGGDDKGAADTTATPDTTAADAAVTTEASEYVDPGVDYEGAEIVIAAYATDSPFWEAAKYCDAFAEEENGDPINDAIYQRNRKAEETLNVTITPYPLDSTSSRVIAPEIVKFITAGEDFIDVCISCGSGIPTLIGTGDMLYDLNTINTLDLSASWWDQKSVEQLAILDALYCVTGDISLYAQFSPIAYFVNKQVLSDFALDNPYDAVRDGSWDIDMMMEMANSVGRDLNGDSIRDINDSYGMLCEAGSMMYMIGACDARLTTLNSDGIPEITINTEKTVELVERFVPFINDRNSVTIATHYTGYGNAFTEVLLPMFAENRALFFNNQLLVAMNLRDMEADFGILPAPKYDESQDEYLGIANASWMSFVTVPVTNGQLDMTGHVLDCLGFYGQQLVTPAYIDTTITSKTLRDEDSMEMLELILASRDYDLAFFYNWGNLYSSFLSTFVSNNTTDFASSYASIEPTAQAAIDKTIEQIRASH